MKVARTLILWLLAALFCLGAAAAGAAENLRRVALVVGNSSYPSGALENPVNDASAVAESLKRLGFDVTLTQNARKTDFDAAVKRFGDRAEKAEVAILFYAGHGIQVNGFNYLVPIDARPQSERDLKREMVKLDDIIDDMGNAKVKLVFFDACRDNPLARSFTRGGSRGLAAPAEASGTLISFATKHGNTASDGEGRHSPYTEALLAELAQPSAEIERLLKTVSQNVKKRTNGQQEPWKYGSLDGDFYFLPPAASPATPSAPVATAPATDPVALELAFWNGTLLANNTDAYRAYLRQYPGGRFAPLAEAAIVRAAPTARPATANEDWPAGKTFSDCSDCPELVVVPAGSFAMGSPLSESERFEDEGPQHTVRIARPFAVGKFEVTRGQFAAFVAASGHRAEGCSGYDPAKGNWSSSASRSWRAPGFAQDDRHPAVCISWNDARQYVKWLTAKTGKTYRLPSEAEWEYAARAGSSTARFWGDDAGRACRFANVGDRALLTRYPDWKWEIHDCQDGAEHTSAVGRYQANRFGLYDMLGNAWEWTEDCFHDGYDLAPADGSAWTDGECGKRIVRGGSWDFKPQIVRVAYRGKNPVDYRSHSIGLRVVRDLNP